MKNAALVLFLFFVACAATLTTFEGHPYHAARNANVYVTDSARAELDSLFRWSVHNRLETGACIPKRAYSIHAEPDGTTTYWIRGIEPGTILERRLTAVIWGGTLCGDTLPSVHTHWLDKGPECPDCVRWVPSPIDANTAKERPQIPFHVIIADTGVYLIYVVKP